MKQLICEMCGSTDLVKQDGVFVCQNCGTKYSVEEAKKMMVEGTVEVTGSVKVDSSEKVQNLYAMARRAKGDNNAELAAKYYEMITFEAPTDWEAFFYFNYFKTQNSKLGDMRNSVISLANSMPSTFNLIDQSDKSEEGKWEIAQEIIGMIDTLCVSFLSWAKSHYEKFSNLTESVSDLAKRANAIGDLQKSMADLLEKYFADRSSKIVASYLKSYVSNYLLLDILPSYAPITLKYLSKELIAAESRIKAIEPNYQSLVDEANKEKSDTEESANAQNNGEMIQVNYQVGHYGVSNQWRPYPNSAGGNTVRYAVKNIGTKPIKYYSFCFVPYNAVGDAVKSTIGNESEKWVRGTGPIAPNGISNECYLENAWYNNSIKSVKLVKAEIEYMDGSKKTIPGDQITSITRINPNAKQANNVKNVPPTPKSAKVCFALSVIVPIITLIFMYPLCTNLGDVGLLISLVLVFGAPLIFAVIGRVIYELSKMKK